MRFFPCRIWQVPTTQVVCCISACVYAAFYEFPDKISCSNIIGCRKITVTSFSILECTETVIARITDNCSWTIIGKKPAGIPRTESGYVHLSPVRLVLTSFFDIPFSPQMQLLFLSSRYLSFCFQILKNDHIRMFSSAILAERLFQSEIVLPLRKTCYYSPLAEVGVFSTEINFLPRTVPSDRIMV